MALEEGGGPLGRMGIMSVPCQYGKQEGTRVAGKRCTKSEAFPQAEEKGAEHTWDLLFVSQRCICHKECQT